MERWATDLAWSSGAARPQSSRAALAVKFVARSMAARDNPRLHEQRNSAPIRGTVPSGPVQRPGFSGRSSQTRSWSASVIG